MDRKGLISTIDNLSIIIIGANLLLLPLFFLTNTTEFYIFPKQLLLTSSTLILLLLWGGKTIMQGKISFRSSPFNFPIFLFGASALVSAFLSPNLYESVIQAIPLVAVLFFTFMIINTISSRSSFNLILTILTLGALLSSVVSIFYYFGIYILPLEAIQAQNFTPLGTPVQHIAFLIPVLVLSSFFIIKRAKEENFVKLITRDYSIAIQSVACLIILAGIALTLYKFLSTDIFRPMPMQHGFQIAVASLSDSARTFYSFLLGSGYGTFFTDFTRFKDISFNSLDILWNRPFTSSSSYFLTLVATTGVIGTISYLLIGLRLLKSRTKDVNPLFVAVAITYVVSFLIPYLFPLVALLFILIGLYINYLYLNDSKKVFDSNISLVSFKQGLFSFDEEKSRKNSPILTVLLALVILIFVGFIGFYLVQYTRSDLKFAESLHEEQGANAQKIYDLQRSAIEIFPYRSNFYRIFSQLNLALANSLVANIPQGEEPSEETQQNILVLLQQSINTSRRAVALSPMTSTNWENLAGIYRALIGVGENAEQFAVASLNQAIALNPTDPRLRIELGGIYYQFEQFDQAQVQFATAVRLKNDYANAHYNLGHALEQQGQLDLALQQYQIVLALVENSQESKDQIQSEIDTLRQQISQESVQEGQNEEAENIEPAEGDQGNLEIQDEPENQFPEQNPRTEIPGPPSPAVSTTPTPDEEPETTPSQTQE